MVQDNFRHRPKSNKVENPEETVHSVRLDDSAAQPKTLPGLWQQDLSKSSEGNAANFVATNMPANLNRKLATKKVRETLVRKALAELTIKATAGETEQFEAERNAMDFADSIERNRRELDEARRQNSIKAG